MRRFRFRALRGGPLTMLLVEPEHGSQGRWWIARGPDRPTTWLLRRSQLTHVRTQEHIAGLQRGTGNARLVPAASHAACRVYELRWRSASILPTAIPLRLGLAALCVALAQRSTLIYTVPHRPQRVRGRPGPSPDEPKPLVICHRRRGDGVGSRQDVQAEVDSGALAASHRRSDAERVGWKAAGEPCRRQRIDAASPGVHRGGGNTV